LTLLENGRCLEELKLTKQNYVHQPIERQDLLVRTIEAEKHLKKRKIMGNHYADLFRIIFTLNCLILFLSFTEVKSAPVTSIIDVMKNDQKLCSTSKFVYDSNYIKPCASIVFPTSGNYNSETLNSFLCLGVYDTAYKICQYSSQKEISLNSTATFNSYVEKYIPNENMAQEEFCNSLKGFTSLYDKIDSLLKQLITSLNNPHECMRICFDFRDKFQPLCAIFAWINSINDDILRSEKKETKHHDMVSDKSHINQSKDEVMIKDVKTAIESKKIEIKESKEQERNQITADSNNNNNNVKENNSLEVMKFDGEKKSDTEKTNNIQKKLNISETQTHKSVSSKFKDKNNNIGTELSTNAEVAKPIKESPPNSDSQSAMNNAKNNLNKKIVNEKNAQKSNKEQNIDDVKPSTLSENTQDHYDAVNPEENMENDIDGINTYL